MANALSSSFLLGSFSSIPPSLLPIPSPLPPLLTFHHPKRPIQSSLTSIDDLICRFLDPPLRPSIDPKFILAGNFAPVAELPPTACEVEGFLPACLDGAYIRNGPNPQFVPRGPYHAFDGDGMLHSVRISGGQAVFCSRFVNTYKYKVEKEIGAAVVLNSFSSFTGVAASLARSAVAISRMLSGQYDLRRGTGTVNTSLAHFGGKLFAIGESDLPYSIKVLPDGDIVTLGRHEAFGDELMTMTAHPKVDWESGEAFAFRHGVTRPFLSYFRINSAGIKQPEVPIFSKPQASMVHDLAVTQNYVVFPDTQIAISLTEILKGNPMVRADPAKIPRLGILPRYAVDETGMQWIVVPGFNMLHAFNAWEEDGDTIVMVASNMLPVENFLENVESLHTSIERIEINLTTKTVRRTPISDQCLELGNINQAYVGKKNRYLYAAIESPMPKVAGVVKLDLSRYNSGDCTVATRLFEPGCYGGEPCFVARDADNPAAAEEDDGYLVSYVHDERINVSKLIVMDAKSASLEIVAAVKLPQRVPYGFHGIFVSQNDLHKLLLSTN
ncbi:probable carotenoid cleavage dioxygenase 4, chloroplastic [Andrographis paniculata]|uniref:probable carotenoid cleavage dioxygenase 4, chloroplastic n=1 Tax=Andrographis paniculata TaxID=175694 RepID=UPI0021E6F6B3|nr:probable carotenoid cleavage dioxygenase 4, chloroplastic [Andrographis paniculata]